MRAAVVFFYTDCYEPRVYFRENFLRLDSATNEIFDDDNLLIDFFDGWVIFMGLVDILPSTKLLILPDPNSEAFSECKVIQLSSDDNLDTIVKQECMVNRLWDEEGYSENSEDLNVLNLSIPSGHLDWSGNTTYRCINDKYNSQFWGWADGHSETEPNLIDTSTNRGYGILLYRL